MSLEKLRIKALRQKNQFTQKEVADKLNITRSTYNNYENESNEPSINTLIKLADFYNVSIDELVGRDTDIINLKYLDESEAYIIKKILKMNQLELAKTRAYVTGLME